MHFTLTDEQEQVQSTAREFLEDSDVFGLARRMCEGDRGLLDDLWSELAGMDYTAITVPADYGGFGDDILLATLLLEEAGRVALPGPFPETVAFAVPLIDRMGTAAQKEAYLPAIADGDRRLSLALYERDQGSLPADIQAAAVRDGDGFRLTGTKTYVPYGDDVDEVVVAARTRDGRGYDGISLFLVDPDRGETASIESLDRTRPMVDLTFDGVELDDDALLGPLHDAGTTLERGLDALRTAICAMLVGGSDRVVDLSIEYATDREQYGHPIGRYQAVKHRIVDMWMDVQAARSLTYYAAWALSTDAPDAARAVSAAKAFCGDHVEAIHGDDMQNHGAMGFTWDHDSHVYLKQAKAWENYLGSPRDHRERIAAARGI